VKPDVHVSSSDILASMRMQATIYVPKHVMRIVRARLWCATRLIELACWVGGLDILMCDDEEAPPDG
jgi:hypothetical protein